MSAEDMKIGYYWVKYSGIWVIAQLDEFGKWYTIAEDMWINDHIKEVGKYIGREGKKDDASDKPSINYEPLLTPVFEGKYFKLHEPDGEGDFELDGCGEWGLWLGKEEAKGMADFIYTKLNRG